MKKFSDFTLLGALTGAEFVPLAHNNANYKIQISDLVKEAAAKIDLTDYVKSDSVYSKEETDSAISSKIDTAITGVINATY